MIIPSIEFVPFDKMARLSRGMVITEKIDGTNGTVFIDENLNVSAASRTRWITPNDDNYGFARWVEEHTEELKALGPGEHRGEWWGSGIQRGYGLTKGDKRFSLFNTHRWCAHDAVPRLLSTANSMAPPVFQQQVPACCSVVPILFQGEFDSYAVRTVLEALRLDGSHAAPGFMKPEGLVVYHSAAGMYFKKTLEKDEMPKTLAERLQTSFESLKPC